MFRPCPILNRTGWFSLYDGFPGAGIGAPGASVPNYADRRARSDVFSSAALFQPWESGRQGIPTESVAAMNVTPSFFEVLGTTATRGRLFAETDGTPGRNKVVLLSHTFAARRPGGIDAVIGRQLRMDDEVYDIVGVLPEATAVLVRRTGLRHEIDGGLLRQGVRRAADCPICRASHRR